VKVAAPHARYITVTYKGSHEYLAQCNVITTWALARATKYILLINLNYYAMSLVKFFIAQSQKAFSQDIL